MRSKLTSCAIVFFYSLATLWAIPTGGVVGCGGGSDPSSPSSLEFDELMTGCNEQQTALTSDLADYIEKDQALVNVLADASSSNAAMLSAADSYIDSAEALVASLDTYGDYMTEYDDRLSSSASLSALKSQGVGSPDALLPVQLGNAIGDCRTQVAACEAMSDEIDKQLCLRALSTKCPSNVVRIGASALFGAGASTVTGLALGSAALTLTGIGAIVLVGVGAGIFFDYCTSGGSLTLKDQSEFGGTCAISSKQVTLGSGGAGVTSLPVGGPGTLRVHIDGCAPVVFSGVTVGTSGLNLSVKCVPVDEATEEDADGANDDSGAEDGAVDPGTGTCDSVAEVFVNPSPTDPAPLQDVAVTATVFPKATGCTVSYSVSGTDDYSASGTPSSDSNGTISFTIPGGAEGVIDTVTVTSGSESTTIVYTF